MTRVTGILLAAGLALGAAACGTGGAGTETGPESSTPPVATGGTLVLESARWAKGSTSPSTAVEYDAVIDAQYSITSMFGDEYMKVKDIADDEVTVLFYGVYRTSDGSQTMPVFTLSDGESVTFGTDSDDAGITYTLTYER